MHFGVSRGDNQRPCAAGRPKFPARATWFRAIDKSPSVASRPAQEERESREDRVGALMRAAEQRWSLICFDVAKKKKMPLANTRHSTVG